MIKDTKGRGWEVAVTIGGVRGFEKRTGQPIFKLLFDLWQKHKEKFKENDTVEAFLTVAIDLFPGVEDAAALVYECARSDASPKPSFEDFCDTVSPIALAVEAMKLVQGFGEFMPDREPDLKRGGGGSGSPLAR